MPIRLTIKYAHELAESNQGLCISRIYLNNHEDLLWKCKQEHVFEKPLKRVIKGEWCPYCSGKYVIVNLSELNIFAEKKGGKYLGSKDLKVSEVGEWECGDGHRWHAIVNNVINLGSWCKICKNNRGEQITKFIFESFTGKLFPSKRPSWLRTSGKKRSFELDGFNEELGIAFEHQGKQHYESNKTTSRYFSDVGLKNDIEKLEICKTKGVKVLEVPQIGELINLEDAINLIKHFLIDNKIKIISDISKENLASNLTGLNKLQINTLKNIAQSKGGDCLSSVYLGHVYPLIFICSNGHQWEARPNDIRRGSWCAICSKAGGKRKTIEQLRCMFNDIGISCISEEYTNSKEKYLWECKHGHKFQSRYDYLKEHRYCPICNK